jgi:hypothetical protein
MTSSDALPLFLLFIHRNVSEKLASDNRAQSATQTFMKSPECM